MLLDIEARVGELLPSRDEAVKSAKGLPSTQRVRRLEGMTSKRVTAARAIAENPAIVEKVKAQARENEDIPTRTAHAPAIEDEGLVSRRDQVDGQTKGKPRGGTTE